MTTSVSAPASPSRDLAWVVGQLLAFALLIAICLQVAWWGWRWFGPVPTSAVATSASIDPSLARALFGESELASTPAAAAPVVSNIRVKGVYAATGKTPSAAVINTGGRDTVVRIDEKIADGVTLVEVHADHVVIARNGVRERVNVDQPPRAALAANASARPATSAPPPPAASFRLNVTPTGGNGFSLSRNELNNVLQDPRQLDHLGRVGPAPSGGVRVEEANPGSLAQKLGLKSGDVIVSLNGQPVAGPGDLAKFYGQFSTIAAIRAEVRRDGVPVVLQYAIQQ